MLSKKLLGRISFVGYFMNANIVNKTIQTKFILRLLITLKIVNNLEFIVGWSIPSDLLGRPVQLNTANIRQKNNPCKFLRGYF